jgi:hypothetical protein
MRYEPGEKLDRRLGDDHDDVDKHGYRRQTTKEKDLSRTELDTKSRGSQSPEHARGDQHTAERKKIAGCQDSASMLGRAAVLHVGGKRHVEQSGTDAEHQQEETSRDVAERVVTAGIDKHALDRVQQKREDGESASA